MKTVYKLTMILAITTFTGCGGGGGGSSSNTDNSDSSNTIKELASIHKYSISATPTSDGNCKGANGEMVIEGSEVSGTVKTGWGDQLMINGTYNKTNGDIDGGFAKNSTRLAEYSGNIKDNSGTGEWSDSLGCSGTWKATGYSSNYINSSPTPTTTSNRTSSSKSFDPNNLQGYKLSYTGTGMVDYTILFNCDGSFETKASRHGVTVETTHGDTITIDSDKILLKSSVNDIDDVSITLIDGNIVLGKSKDDMGNVITDIKKVSSCN